MCHLGPALTNVLTGVANASLDSIPMVVIAGDVPATTSAATPTRRSRCTRTATSTACSSPCASAAGGVDDVEALPYILDRAFRLAESGRPGPVLVDIPMDMFSREMEEDLCPAPTGTATRR